MFVKHNISSHGYELYALSAIDLLIKVTFTNIYGRETYSKSVVLGYGIFSRVKVFSVF